MKITVSVFIIMCRIRCWSLIFNCLVIIRVRDIFLSSNNDRALYKPYIIDYA